MWLNIREASGACQEGSRFFCLDDQRTIHEASRKNGPFRAVSCDFVDSAFRPSLIDALLRLESSVDAEHLSGYKLSAFLPIVMAR